MSVHREPIQSHLELLANPAEQADYQAKVPAVNVVNELVNQWFGDLYHPMSEAFTSEFSAKELAAMQQFSEAFEAMLPGLPDTLPAFHASTTSAEVSALAKQLLQVFATSQ